MTTIPSYYCSDRPAVAADIARTREWWDRERDAYDCFISAIVLEELSEGNYPHKDACLKLVEELPLLAVNRQIEGVAEIYRQKKLMPKLPVRDALHVAIASHYHMDYLLTWNCKHIANDNKVRHLEVLNVGMGLTVPILTTPDKLQIWEEKP